MRLALLASLITFAGSMTGFAVATAPGDPGREVARTPAAAEEVVRVPDDCPKARSWEDAA